MIAITWREARPEDFEYFFDLHRHTLGPYVDQVWGWDDDEQRAYLHRTIEFDTTHVIVVDGADAGRLNLAEQGDDDVYIGLIEVAPHLQRRGIGGRIIHSVLAAAGAEGKGVRLNVLAVNAGAHRLYRHLGFHEVSREGTAARVRIQMRADPLTSAGDPGGEVPAMSDPWRVRPATPEDRVFIVEMARQASVLEGWALPAADSDDVRSVLPGDDDEVIVAENLLGRPAGAAWTFHSDPPLMVDATGASIPELCIAVTRQSRRRGAGSALLDELAQRCGQRYDAICLNVHQNNPARALYRRQGFDEIGQGRGALGVSMRKDLRGAPTMGGGGK